MTPDQIIQLRTKLISIITITNTEPLTVSDGPIGYLAREALTLLPCPTCNDTKIKKPEDGCGKCLAEDGNCYADCPCPDCQ
jgi:hypothetical protein